MDLKEWENLSDNQKKKLL